jgi:aldose 1-epimerase
MQEIRLTGPDGTTASVLDWGATLRDLVVPAPGGRRRRVVLGYQRLDDYLANPAYLGAIAGRHANRIAQGRFRLDGRDYQLTLNENGRTHLHGGVRGFSHQPWRVVEQDEDSITLGLTSPDGDQGYPGTVEVHCTYTLSAPATLRVALSATTDAPTPLNLAHHSYFTLEDGADIRSHRLQLGAAAYTPVDADLIPTGAITAVTATPFDFQAPRPIDIALDHNFVLSGQGPAAILSSADGRARLTVTTDAPGLQVYDGRGLQALGPGIGGQHHFPYAGLAMEPQTFPDGPNHENFPDAILRPGQTWRLRSEFRFEIG